MNAIRWGRWQLVVVSALQPTAILDGGGSFLDDRASGPPCDTGPVLEDPTPHLRVRHTGIPPGRFGSTGLASSHHLGSRDTDPGNTHQA
jgi:hypothetical protein